MKKIILFFCCFLAVVSVTLNAQEIRPMPADSAYGVVHISVCNLRDEGKFTSGMSCLLYTSPSPRDVEESRMPSSA